MPDSALLQNRADGLLGVLAGAGEFLTASDGQIVAVLEAVGDLRRAVDAIGAAAAAELARRSGSGPSNGDASLCRRLGDKTPAAAVARLCGIEFSEATGWCAAGDSTAVRQTITGELLPPRYVQVAQRFAAGDLTPRAVRQIVTALDEIADKAQPDEVLNAERLLLEAAHDFTARELAKLCTRLVDLFDPDGVAPREEEQRARRGLRITRLPGGMTRWVFTLDPLSEGFLTAALDARTAPRRIPRFLSEEELQAEEVQADPRTSAQRRLDAFVDIARESLTRDEGEVAGTAVTMVVTIPLETLERGVGAGEIDGVDGSISAGTARRLAAEAEIIPAVLGTGSRCLDYGDSLRLFSEAQRRAMALRDGGCVWCGVPPGWCEAAHVSPWALTKQTNLDNGVLMCPPCHRRFDLDKWEFEWRDDGPWLIPPPWIDVSRRPRRGRSRAATDPGLARHRATSGTATAAPPP